MGSKKKLAKKIEEIKHPGSRKTVQAIREIKKIKKRQNIKKNFVTKANVEGKKLCYFSEKLEEIDQSRESLHPREFKEMIESYFHRFDDELEQIKLKVEVNKKHRQNQHSNREGVIKISLENDIKNFNAGGILLPDLTDKSEFKKFKSWDGNSHNIQHLTLKYISRKYLEEMQSKLDVEDSEMNEVV